MNKYYISSNCYLLNKKLYIDNIEGRDIKLNTRNWKTHLKEYGWTTMPINWRRKLNNTNFGILDCGSNGDCLFHVICEALNLNLIYIHLTYLWVLP